MLVEFRMLFSYGALYATGHILSTLLEEGSLSSGSPSDVTQPNLWFDLTKTVEFGCLFAVTRLRMGFYR